MNKVNIPDDAGLDERQSVLEMQKLLAHKLEEMAVPQRPRRHAARSWEHSLLAPRLDGDEFDRLLE